MAISVFGMKISRSVVGGSILFRHYPRRDGVFILGRSLLDLRGVPGLYV